MTEDLRHTPPQDLDAEQAVLGACMIEPVTGTARLRPEDFYKTVHRAVFAAFQAIHTRGEQVDLVTANAELRKPEYASSIPQGFSMSSYLAALVSQVPTAAGFRQHEKLVIEMAQRRAAIHAASDIMSAAYALKDPLEIVSSGVTRLNDIRDGRGDIVSVPYRDLVHAGYSAIELFFTAAKEGRLIGIPTGFSGVDALTNGFMPSWFYVIAGRTGKGKTSFAMQCARAAARAGHPAGVVSVEMSEEQLSMRDLSSESGVPLYRLNSGNISDRDWEDIAHAAGRLAGLPIRGVFSAFHADEVERAIDHLVQTHGCRVIFVDYLQLLSIKDHTGTREQEVSKISRMHKRKAKEHRVPVVALAQLNRSVENRKDQKPQLSDLRESGSIEQDADVVAFVHHDECKCAREVACYCGNRDRAWYLQRKGRMNGTGDVPLVWDGKTTTFKDIHHP